LILRVSAICPSDVFLPDVPLGTYPITKALINNPENEMAKQSIFHQTLVNGIISL